MKRLSGLAILLLAAVVLLAPPLARAAAFSDFDNDNRSDVFWRNSATGEDYVYPMNGTAILGTEGYARTVADLNWKVVGIGDFDGDGKADVLWRNSSTGENYVYFMDGTSIKPTEGYIRTVADQNWKVAGVGDFDGDGKSDILWRNSSTGENYIYPMDGLAIKAGEGYIRTVADQNWQVAGVADFNGNGNSDILWRNSSTGENYLYFMAGLVIQAGEGYLRTVADLNWKIVGTGDFDGDLSADILWRNVASGENYAYLMDGTTIATEGYLRTVADQSWKVQATGDYDGDGKADILWRHSMSGENYLYFMDGTAIKPSEGYIRTVANQDWSVQPSPGSPAATASNIVFVTSTTYAANFGSVATADASCAARAAAAGLPGEYVAWLSSSTSNAVSRLGSARGWVRVDGLPFADTIADITSGKMFYPPQLDEFGAVVSGSAGVFTGTKSDGTVFSPQTCSNWTSTSGQVIGGRPDSGGLAWTFVVGASCAVPSRLYCFGKSHTTPLSFTPASGRIAFQDDSGLSATTSLSVRDAICQSAASAFGLPPGTYKALLAVEGASAASRFNTAGAPWVRVDGVRVFDPASQLLTSTMKAPLNVTATGLYASGMTVWAGAPDFATAGTAATTCGNWSSTAGTVYFGKTDQSSDFFNSSSDCLASRRGLCLQQ